MRYLLSSLVVLAVVSSVRAESKASGENLLVNGGFERNGGVGTVPEGWKTVDGDGDYFGWVGPRAEQRLGGVGARSGRWFAGLDTEKMGVDSNGQEYAKPRSAICQTVEIPRGSNGIFRLYYNDEGTTSLAFLSVIRLGYTIDSDSISAFQGIVNEGPGEAPSRSGAGMWSQRFHRVGHDAHQNVESLGGWTLAELPVTVPPGEGKARLTLWIGVFDNQNSSELGYWRVDDASLVLTTASKPVSLGGERGIEGTAGGREVQVADVCRRLGCSMFSIHAVIFPFNRQRAFVTDLVERPDDRFEVNRSVSK